MKLGILSLIVGTLLFITVGPEALWSGNQHTYTIHALAFAGHGNLDQDPFTEFTDPFPAYSLIVLTAVSLNAGWLLHVINLMLFWLYAWGLLRMAMFVSESKRLVFWTAGMIIAHYLLWHPAFDYIGLGFARQMMMTASLTPASFGAFTLAGIVNALWRKSAKKTSIFLSIGAIMHPGYAVATLILWGFWILLKYPHRSWKEPAKTIAAPVVALLNIFWISGLSQGTLTEKLQAASILVWRFPHHADPKVFMTDHPVVVLFFLTISMLIYYRFAGHNLLFSRFLLKVSLFAISMIVLTLIFPQLGAFTPWRVMTVILPILLSLTLSKLHYITPEVIRIGAIGLACVFLLLGASRAFDPTTSLYQTSPYEEGDLYAVPSNLYDFRINTGYPTYVLWKTHPWAAPEIIEWKRRLDINDRAFETGDFGPLLEEGVTKVMTGEQHGTISRSEKDQ